MGKRAIIREGDTTSHGGKVLEGQSISAIDGKAISSVGHQVFCPTCKGIFQIGPDLLGRRYSRQIMGQNTAVEGMRTTCGAVLIASQSTATIDDVGHGDGFSFASAAPGSSGLAPASTLLADQQCRHPDNAIPIATYIVEQMNENPLTDVGRKITENNSFDESKEAKR